ncbi:MAG: tetratricopeptide repeat protein [Myxococcales bacterium]|nr:tetratricopeptide repeat protein [Myxococcales bacterium]
MSEEGREDTSCGWKDAIAAHPIIFGVVIALILVAAVIAIYAQSFRFGAVRFDDPQYLSGSVHLQNGLSVDGLKWAFSAPFGSNYFPLTLLSHMLDRTLFGDHLGGHHLTGVALHALNSILLFGALFSMTGARGSSAVVAMLFAIHPLNVESVAWIAERKNVLSTTFWILSMWAYASYARRASLVLYLCAALLLALGLLAKPMLVTLPLVFLLLDYWPLDRIRSGKPKAAEGAPSLPRRSIGFLIAEKLPLLAISVASSVVTLHVQSRGILSSETLPLLSRLANAVVAYARYLGKTAWPADLTMHYPHPYMPAMGGEPLEVWQIVGAATLLLALSVLAIAAVRRRYLLVGWFWFLGVLVPTIGLVQVGNQALADRYAYVPAIGLFLAVSWAGSEWIGRFRITHPGSTRALLVGVAAGIAALALASWHQVGYWRDSVSLFEHTLAAIPKNPKIRYNLANEYRARGDMDAAIRNYRIALETDSESVNTRINLGNALQSKGELDAAVDVYQSALDREPRNANAHNSMGTVLRAKGDVDTAILRYRYAIALDPDFYLAHYNLANALQSKGELDQAVVHYLEALEENVRDPKIFNNLGNAFWSLDRNEDAETAYRVAIAVDPGYYRAHNNLGALLASQEKFDQAIAHYRLAIAASPDYASAHNNLGDALRAQGKLDEAVDAYAEVLRADPGFAQASENLENARRESEGLRD